MTNALVSEQDRVKELRDRILSKLTYSIGKPAHFASQHDWLNAAILALRDDVVDGWSKSIGDAKASGRKRVYYLSLEFLIGRLFKDALGNTGTTELMRHALGDLGVNLDEIAALEPDAALGNGGLGRLAACFMESMATVGVYGLGYGIRYDHGLFAQKIVDGQQVESPETWLSFPNPWEFLRREIVHEVNFGGHTHASIPSEWDARKPHVWVAGETVLAIAFDTPVVGQGAKTTNTLRLWSARAVDPLQLDAFNAGDHHGAVMSRSRAESISRVLYPSDSSPAGHELRLRQEYFFTTASLQDLIRRHLQQFGSVRNLHDKAAIQLNDTHPAIAIAELMRLLVDVYLVPWAEAWNITRRTCSYTNHTLLPEALETWPVELLARLLPRHLAIIYAINDGLLTELRARGAAAEAISSVSLIDEGHGRRVRMGNLAFVGSHTINGVSALHTDLMKKTVFRDLNAAFPGRITNMTNGITPRRWFAHANPGLASMVRDCVGDGPSRDLLLISAFEPFSQDAASRDRFAAIKLHNKHALADHVRERMGIEVDPRAMFDVHVKRIHEYKRQLLNILQTIALYQEICDNPQGDWAPRVKFFAGKAAASYTTAKSIIRLINDVSEVVNRNALTRDRLKVVFLPNFNVSLAEIIIPAADLSEQISTAGLEASGTGNMKFALNGALTIGTLDGANVEMLEHVGAENIFIFGMTAEEVEQRKRHGYCARSVIAADARLNRAVAAIARGDFSAGEPTRYHALVEGLFNNDVFRVADDFSAYWKAHREVDAVWKDRPEWTRKAMLNTARMGWFSSDRTIRQYADEIWNAPHSGK